MSKTRAELRAMLAREVGRYFAGTATGGTTTTLVDTGGLVRWTETDALKGAYVLITAAGGAAPEGESRRIKAFNATSQTITVDVAFTAAPESGDSYDLYNAPLTLDQWNECINRAILSAWPEVYNLVTVEVVSSYAPTLTPGGTIHEILFLDAYRTANPDEPAQRIPPQLYTVAGDEASGYTVSLHRPISTEFTIRVVGKGRYPELSTDTGTTGTTTLDPDYLQAASQAFWHQLMANSGRGQADQSAHLQLMNHWQQAAAQRRQVLGSFLLGGRAPAAPVRSK